MAMIAIASLCAFVPQIFVLSRRCTPPLSATMVVSNDEVDVLDKLLWLGAKLESEDRLDQQVSSFFNRIDENGDGIISFDELSDHLRGQGFSEGATEHVFDLLDVNRDGEISAAELRLGFDRFDDPAIRLAIGLGATEADEIFDQIDVNHDGEISLEELEAFLELNASASANGSASASARTIFKTLDANGDGSVCRSELRQGYAEYSEFRKLLGLR